MSKLHSERLMEQASAETGLSDFGDLPFQEALDAQLWALEHESGHPADRLEALVKGHVDLLVKRLRLVEDRKQFPEIADERIEAPIIVTGLPRTGSTHLHALLAARPGSRAPLQWEMNLPSPPPDAATFATDSRIAEVQAALDARPNNAELQAIHPFGATRPEQCIGLVDWGFVNQAFLAPHRIPSYYEWFLGADQRVLYEHHRRALQQLQWHNPGDWVLKWPKHLFSLQGLLAAYPDARIVWTHRDPASVISSATSFVGTIRKMASPLFDPVRFGAEWVGLEETGLLRGIAAREHAADERRFYDVHYNDLTADPVATVTGIYEHFGVAVDDETRRRVASFQDDNPKDKHGRHTYTPEQFGLDADQLRRRFAPYIDKYGVEPDRRRKDAS
ncbi:MAG: sulfotransferase [Ilumatobacteraceae bacterium]